MCVCVCCTLSAGKHIIISLYYFLALPAVIFFSFCWSPRFYIIICIVWLLLLLPVCALCAHLGPFIRANAHTQKKIRNISNNRLYITSVWLVLFYSIHHNARMMWNEIIIISFFFFGFVWLYRITTWLEMESVENGNFSPEDFFLSIFGFCLFIFSCTFLKCFVCFCCGCCCCCMFTWCVFLRLKKKNLLRAPKARWLLSASFALSPRSVDNPITLWHYELTVNKLLRPNDKL